MATLTKQDYLTLRQAAELLPGRPNRSTMSRWAHHGVRGVQLATILVGGRRYTTRDAIDQFITALSEQQDADGGTRSRELAAT
jgi:Protein of unknown function (DUF1580)